MKRAKKIGLCVLIIFLVVVALVLFFGRGWSGSGESLVHYKIGKTETHNNTSTTTTSSSAGNAAFAGENVSFVNKSRHILSRRISARLNDQFKELAAIPTTDTALSTVDLSQNQRAPDLFVTLDLIQLEETGSLTDHTIKATVVATLGTAPWQSTRYDIDSTSASFVHFNWTSTIEYESKFTGVRSDRYGDAVEDIAKTIRNGISNQLHSVASEYPAAPTLSPDFYGPYQAVEDFDFLKELKAQRVMSYYSLFTHNETFWKFQTSTNPLPQLKRIAEQLQAAGWKSRDSVDTNSESYYAQFSHDGDKLEIFRERDQRRFLENVLITNFQFVVHYFRPFTTAEREAATEKLFEWQGPIENLVPFEYGMKAEQRERLYTLLEQQPNLSPRMVVRVGGNYLNRKNTNGAIHMLLRATAMMATMDDYSKLKSDIDSLAERISPKGKLKFEVTPEIYQELGFVELTNAVQTVEVERAFGQPVVLFAMQERRPQTFSLTIGVPQKSAYPYTMMETSGGGRSSSRSSEVAQNGQWTRNFTFDKCSLAITVQPLPDGKQCKITIQTKMAD